MFNRKAKLVDFHRLAVLALILACFTGVLVAQTFNYSRGWTNGKRRSPMTSSFGDRTSEPETHGIWQMQRLKRLLELSQCCETNTPHEAHDKPDEDLNRVWRNVGFDTLSYLPIPDTLTLPRAKI